MPLGHCPLLESILIAGFAYTVLVVKLLLFDISFFYFCEKESKTSVFRSKEE
jgi:hypothetical protein